MSTQVLQIEPSIADEPEPGDDPRGLTRFFEEAAYYRFGLMLGLRNLLHNGFRLGLGKTLGKILQPVNSYTRFPEYAFFGRHIERYISEHPGRRMKVLDVSSPKCFGLSLAYHYDAEIHLSDIDRPSVDEAEVLWSSISKRARGSTYFSVKDARSLKPPANFYDIVFAMSVIEHIEDRRNEDQGEPGDSQAVREMLRVLKPGGLLLVSVPFGPRYEEQKRVGLIGAAQETSDAKPYFFQRIYTKPTAEEFILGPATAAGARLVKSTSVGRRSSELARLYRETGTNFRGLFGCLNPLLSLALNDIHPGIVPVSGEYGQLWNSADIYGDLMLAWEKAA
jgi:SAM-dependent methyltransferase